jgi:hypothetical protein
VRAVNSPKAGREACYRVTIAALEANDVSLRIRTHDHGGKEPLRHSRCGHISHPRRQRLARVQWPTEAYGLVAEECWLDKADRIGLHGNLWPRAIGIVERPKGRDALEVHCRFGEALSQR